MDGAYTAGEWIAGRIKEWMDMRWTDRFIEKDGLKDERHMLR